MSESGLEAIDLTDHTMDPNFPEALLAKDVNAFVRNFSLVFRRVAR